MKKSLSLILSVVFALSAFALPLGANAAAINLEDPDVTIVLNSYKYDNRFGVPGECDITVSYGGTALTEGTDYKINTLTNFYDEDEKMCSFWVFVDGIGSYTGRKTEVFNLPYDTKGKSGKKSNWNIDYDKKIFYVKGSGALYDGMVSENCRAPKTLIIASGITKIGYNNFSDFSNLTKVFIPSTVTSIDSYAFNYLEHLEYVNLSSGVEKIASTSFTNCPCLKYMYVPKTVTKIAGHGIGFYDDDEGSYGKVKGFVMGGVKGTAAEKYAKKYDIKFIAFKQSSIKDLTAKTKAFKVKWNKAGGANGYQIQYSTSQYFESSKTVTVKGVATLSKTVKKLKSGKKYYVRIRTYKKVNKKTYYSSWSKAKSVKVK